MTAKRQERTSDIAIPRKRAPRPSMQSSLSPDRDVLPDAIVQKARLAPYSLTAPEVLQLQGSIGNAAVGKLLAGTVQRRPAGVRTGRAEGALISTIGSNPIIQLRAKSGSGLRKSLTYLIKRRLKLARRELSLKSNDPKEVKWISGYIKAFTGFLKGADLKLPVVALKARVRETRSFFGPGNVALLKRGAMVDVLGLKGSWCWVRIGEGKQGWLHNGRIIPRFVLGSFRPGKTRGGTTRGEAGTARRA